VRVSSVYLEHVTCAKTTGLSEEGKRCQEILEESSPSNESLSDDDNRESQCRCEYYPAVKPQQ